MDATTRRAIRTWVADLDTLEGHLEEALAEQRQLDPRSPEVADAIAFLHDTVTRSHARIHAHLETMADDGSRSLADSVGDVLGSAAGLVDRVRGTSVARGIRDDYVAMSRINVGYEMLLTSALATGAVATARLAELALGDGAAALQRINEVLALATIDDLQSDPDVSVVNSGVEDAVNAAIDRAWQAA